ncbi:S66 family peptidase [Kroppenstedtia guangzhouensis]|uniref:S66 family peptidase n=1 Tax=Kroppenstedtia guangzhouensis TaxID=1274356 RepID=UPI0027E581F1|nr:LD-carboxypeptidase [Kroppenstedtia guangzhouensis]
MTPLTKIRYPQPLRKGDTIAVTAPSSGVPSELHFLLDLAQKSVIQAGYRVMEGDTVRTQKKAVSAPRERRAQELTQFLLDPVNRAVIPPWGGEFLMEILPLMDWEALRTAPPKWVLGYSDISTFTFSYTLLTGTASAHGTNYIDLGSREWDPLTRRWADVLSMTEGEQIKQVSSPMYQSSWERRRQQPEMGFDLDTPTRWRVLGDDDAAVHLSGRLLGGCIETLSSLVGTSFAPVEPFAASQDEGILWFLESAESSAAEIYRRLWQMKEGGWFRHATGVLIGRPGQYRDAQDFGLVDALGGVFGDLNIPVVYDVDIGHVPPQLTLVNGARGKVKVEAGKGEVWMELK